MNDIAPTPPGVSAEDAVLISRLETLRHAWWPGIPLLLAVPVAFAAAFTVCLAPPAWAEAGLGAAGWVVALQLRLPVSLVAARLSHDPRRIALAVTGASGPAEEVVRVVLVLLVAAAFRSALWLGLGWAAVEVVYTAVTAVLSPLVLPRLLRDQSDKARQARELLLPQLTTVLAASPAAVVALGAAERIGATALHTGFTLLLAAQPWLALLTAPIHTGVNLGALTLQRRSLLLTEAVVVAAGAVAFVGGLAALPHP